MRTDRVGYEAQVLRGAAVVSVVLGLCGYLLFAALASGLARIGGRYFTIYAYTNYVGSFICAAAGTYASGIVKSSALRRFGRSERGRPPRWSRAVSNSPRWLRLASNFATASMVVYSAAVLLETWHRQDSFNVGKLAALFSAFCAALAWGSAVALTSAAAWQRDAGEREADWS